MKKEFKPEFIQVFLVPLQDKNLQPLDNLVLGAIYWYERLKDGKCFASNQSIGQIVNATTQSVANSIRRLSQYGYIECTYKDEKKRNRMQITCLLTRVNVSNDTSGDVSTIHQVSNRDTSGDEQNKNSIKNNRKEYIYTSFQEFWSVYPKKVGKGLAESSWLKICGGLSKETVREIIEHVRKRSVSDEQWLKDNGQFIPNPATFLNQKRWYDEYKKIKSNNEKILYL